MTLVLEERSSILIGPHSCGKTLCYVLPTICRVNAWHMAMPFQDDEKPYALLVVSSPEIVKELL